MIPQEHLNLAEKIYRGFVWSLGVAMVAAILITIIGLLGMFIWNTVKRVSLQNLILVDICIL